MRKAGTILVFVGLIASFGWLNYLDTTFASNLPRVANEATGHTVPISVRHGTQVFASTSDVRRLSLARGLFYFVITCALVGFAIQEVAKRRRAVGSE
jgi:hypothetical protein